MLQIFTVAVILKVRLLRDYGSYLKSGDSWVRWTANSAVDCDWWGNGGYGTNSSSNYTRVSQSTSQICDGSGNATIRLTVTNYNAANDAYAGFIDVQWSTNNTNWVDVVDGRAIADGESITFESPDQIATSSQDILGIELQRQTQLTLQQMHLGQYLVDRQTVLLITLNLHHLVSVQLLVNTLLFQ